MLEGVAVPVEAPRLSRSRPVSDRCGSRTPPHATADGEDVRWPDARGWGHPNHARGLTIIRAKTYASKEALTRPGFVNYRNGRYRTWPSHSPSSLQAAKSTMSSIAERTATVRPTSKTPGMGFPVRTRS